LRAVSPVSNSSYFTFDNYIYKQTFETPRDSPLFFIDAYLVLRNLEERALEKIGVSEYLSFLDM